MRSARHGPCGSRRPADSDSWRSPGAGTARAGRRKGTERDGRIRRSAPASASRTIQKSRSPAAKPDYRTAIGGLSASKTPFERVMNRSSRLPESPASAPEFRETGRSARILPERCDSGRTADVPGRIRSFAIAAGGAEKRTHREAADVPGRVRLLTIVDGSSHDGVRDRNPPAIPARRQDHSKVAVIGRPTGRSHGDGRSFGIEGPDRGPDELFVTTSGEPCTRRRHAPEFPSTRRPEGRNHARIRPRYGLSGRWRALLETRRVEPPDPVAEAVVPRLRLFMPAARRERRRGAIATTG